MKTLYVTIPDEKLLELIDKYNNSSPVGDVDDFSVYLSLGELKRFRDTRVAEPEARALTLEELRKMDGFPVWMKFEETSPSHFLKSGWYLISINVNEVFAMDNKGHCIRISCNHFGKTRLAYDCQPKGE